MTHLSSLFEILQKTSPYIAIPACRGDSSVELSGVAYKGQNHFDAAAPFGYIWVSAAALCCSAISEGMPLSPDSSRLVML